MSYSVSARFSETFRSLNRVGLILAFVLISSATVSGQETPAYFMEVQTSATDTQMAAAASHKSGATSISLPVRVNLEALRRHKSVLVRDEAGHDLQLRRHDTVDESTLSPAWHGQVLKNGEVSGSATITVTGNRLHASITSGQRQYRVITTPEGNHFWQRIRSESHPAQHPPNGPIRIAESLKNGWTVESSTAQSGFNSGGTDNAPATVDIVAQYTANAINAYPDETALRLAIRNAIERTNTAFINGGLDHRVRLMGIQYTDFEEQSGGMRATLPAFSESSTTNLLQEYYKADLNALFGAFNDFCGIAYLPAQLTNDFSYANSATNVNPNFPCMDGTTTAHEIGHNLGLEHNPEDAGNPDSALFPYGFGHFIENRFATIMSYHPGCGGGVYHNCRFEISYFSDPERLHPASRLPLGIHGRRNNVEALKTSMPIGAQWGQPTASLDTAWGLRWHTSGQGLWQAVQADQLSLHSGIVIPGETSRLTLERESTRTGTLRFTALGAGSEFGTGTLTVSTEDQTLLTVDDLAQRADYAIELPEGTERVHFDWRPLARASQTQLYESVILQDVSDSANQSSSSGCALGASTRFDPLLLILTFLAGSRLLKTTSPKGIRTQGAPTKRLPLRVSG